MPNQRDSSVSSEGSIPIEKRIAGWLRALADVTVAQASQPVSPERIMGIASLLAKDGMPAGAYTSSSLHHVAGLSPWFPAYADVRDALGLWWERNRPAPPANTLPGVEIPDGLDVVDRKWFVHWHKRRGEIRAEGGLGVQAKIRTLASLVRDQSPLAWRAISGSEPSQAARTDADRERVSAVVGEFAREVAEKARVSEPAAFVPRDVTVKGDALAALRAARPRRSTIDA